MFEFPKTTNVFTNIKKVCYSLKSKQYHLKPKLKVYNSNGQSVALYGGVLETKTQTEIIKKQQDAFQTSHQTAV